MRISYFKLFPLRLLYVFILFQFAASFACTQNVEPKHAADTTDFLKRVFSDTTDFYYVDFNKVENNTSTSSPIGVFDSGTGGLTVLDALMGFDNFNDATKDYSRNGDGIKDFNKESFIYFGDQANMPYGNYSAMNKTGFLKELILRDALFLLGNKHYETPEDTTWQTNKESVKLIVIACNTATAYGKDDIQKMLSDAESSIPVIGVIDAGVRGALSTFGFEENGTAAVIATEGTVTSNGYHNTFLAQKSENKYTGDLEFIQQSGFGIAEAVDEEINFIDRKATKIRTGYQGPSMNSEHWKIKEELLPVYNFDTTANALLYEKENGRYTEIQLNNAENYIRYHLVNLCEQLRQNKVKNPLKTLILGCTHYPFYASFFQSSLNELYNLNLNGNYIYRDYLNDSIILIDPAINTAKEVHEYLFTNNLLNTNTRTHPNQFYISVPDRYCQKAETDSTQNFTYSYKYSRGVNHIYDTRQVPMNSSTVNKDVLSRIKKDLPQIYDMMINNEK